MAEKSFGVKEIKIDGTGTPTIESPSGGNLNLTAATTSASGNLSVGGNLTVSGSGTPTIESPSGGNINITAGISAFSGDVTLADVKKVRLGNTAGDFDIYYDNNAYLTTGSRGFVINSYNGAFSINGGSNNDFKFGINYLGTVSAGDFIPDGNTNNGDFDLGIAAVKWRNLYLDGTANVGSLVATGTITGNLTGNADSATKVNIQETNSGTRQIVFCAQNGTGNQDLYIDTNDSHLSYDPNLGRLYLPNYTGGSGGTNGSGLHHLSSTTISRDGMTVGADQSASSPGYLSSNCIRLDAQTGNLNATGIATATTLSVSNHISGTNTLNKLITNTTDGSDDKAWVICGGHDSGSSYGSLGAFYGNELGSNGGAIDFYGGQTTVGNISFITGRTTGTGIYRQDQETRLAITHDGKIGIGTTGTPQGLPNINAMCYIAAMPGQQGVDDYTCWIRNDISSNGNGLLVFGGGNENTYALKVKSPTAGYDAFYVKGNSQCGMHDKLEHIGDDDTYLRFPSNNSFSVTTGGSERIHISSVTGDIYLSNADLILAAGKGINFSNTTENGETVSDATFGDFERGTWTPSICYAYGGNDTGVQYSWRQGQYIKFDKLVICWGALKLSNNGSATGAIAIDDLPFAVENVQTNSNITIEGGGYTTKMQGLSSSSHKKSHWMINPIAGVNIAYFRRFSGTSSNDENPNQSVISDSWEVHFTFQYYS